MKRDFYNITIILKSGKKEEFKNLEFNKNFSYETENMSVKININRQIDIDIKLKNSTDKISMVTYNFVLAMKNYSKVIVPDSGRWFLRNTSLIDFWKNCKNFSSFIGDIKLPLFIFLKDNGYVGNAVGIIGKNLETEFKIFEPESNRALNVHTGHISLGIVRGNRMYPLNKTEYHEAIFYYMEQEHQNIPWLLMQRLFSELTKEKYNLKEEDSRNALAPMWCSWVDWDSKDINTSMLLSNIKAGIELGIKNFIIDDGWYGNGLDSAYSVDMNIGDWEPDTQKIPDMKLLVDMAHQLGARLFIWCAPHAVAKNSNAFKTNYNYLIADETGTPIINEPQYFSYCFQCEESRKIMAELCVKLITKWGFDGSKYDLFNWVPNLPCKNPNHHHDTTSMVEGLEKTLELIHQKTKKINPKHMIELKQNYGTPFNIQYGNLMRAGDSPFDLETNYQRTLHIQSYTPYALNDYQTFTKYDSKEEVACIIIKMLAAGIPSYGMNSEKLDTEIKKVIKYYNNLYSYNLNDFRNFRTPLNPKNTAMYMKGTDFDYIFLLSQNTLTEFDKNVLIFNGTYSENLIFKNNVLSPYHAIISNCLGEIVSQHFYSKKLEEIEVPIGGNVQILYKIK